MLWLGFNSDKPQVQGGIHLFWEVKSLELFRKKKKKKKSVTCILFLQHFHNNYTYSTELVRYTLSLIYFKLWRERIKNSSMLAIFLKSEDTSSKPVGSQRILSISFSSILLISCPSSKIVFAAHFKNILSRIIRFPFSSQSRSII